MASSMLTPNPRQTMRHRILDIKPPLPLCVVSQGWPCWLPSIVALRIPLLGAYFPSKYHQHFNHPAWSRDSFHKSFGDHEELRCICAFPVHCVVLALGNQQFCLRIIRVLLAWGFQGQVMLSLDVLFDTMNARDLARLWPEWECDAFNIEYQARVVSHSLFGGASNGVHMIWFRGIQSSAFDPPGGVPRTLKHLLNAAASAHASAIPWPVAIQGAVAQTPLVVGGFL